MPLAWAVLVPSRWDFKPAKNGHSRKSTIYFPIPLCQTKDQSAPTWKSGGKKVVPLLQRADLVLTYHPERIGGSVDRGHPSDIAWQLSKVYLKPLLRPRAGAPTSLESRV
jgi:hypothetical protein